MPWETGGPEAPSQAQPQSPPQQVRLGTEVTPIVRLTKQEEAHAARELTGSSPDVVLVASDLHLGYGRDPLSGTYPLTEHFLQGGAFSRWLAKHAQEPPRASLLLLNGDIFDFLRIDRIPDAREMAEWSAVLRRLGEDARASGLERTISRTEVEYGLRTSDFKTVWKLEVIARGHPEFFGALATWIARGGLVLVMAGNHDVELHWPLVRQAVRDLLVRHGAPPAAAERRVAFAEGALALGNLHVEHGHQYEEMTRVEGTPELDGTGEMRLPIGSFVNRYFINRIEHLSPFIDNVKPVESALLALLRRHPTRVFRAYVRGWRFILRAIQARALNRAVLTIAAALFVPVLTLVLVLVFQLSPGARAWIVEWVPLLRERWARIAGSLGGFLFPMLLPYVLGVLGEAWRRFRGPRRDPLAEGARTALARVFRGASYHRVYAVMGHTHVQDVQALAQAPREEMYVNSGTWTAIWPRDRVDLQGRTLNSFLHFDLDPAAGEYRHQALVWDDHAGEARAATLLKPSAEVRHRAPVPGPRAPSVVGAAEETPPSAVRV